MGEGDGSSEVHGVKTVTTSQVLQHQSHRQVSVYIQDSMIMNDGFAY